MGVVPRFAAWQVRMAARLASWGREGNSGNVRRQAGVSHGKSRALGDIA
jgi:hypothetical protein